jgi:hypothetical protein
MTQLGKILILGNLALSLIFAAWALGIYTQRIDFTKGGGGGAPPGELAKREQRHAIAKSAVEKAYARYDAAARSVAALEARRPVNLAWYADQYSILRTGVDAKGKPAPVRQPVAQKGQLLLGTDGHPALQEVKWDRLQPLENLNRLRQEFDLTQDAILKEKEVLDALVAQEKDLTEQLNGDGKQRKGLRTQMEDVQRELLQSLGSKEFLRRLEKAGVFVVLPLPPEKDLYGEQDWLMQQLYNRLAEERILDARRRQLQARLEEVKKAAAATAAGR